MEIDKSVSSLIALGWSEYESKVYSALINEGRSTASHISKISSVPANRVYQILDRLSDKGHVRRIQGKGSPAVFVAKNPEEVMEEVEQQHLTLISNAKEALKELQERSTRENIPISYTISGRREMNAQLSDIIKRTDEEIVIALDTLAEINLGNIAKGLKDLYSSGKKIRILTPPTGINDTYEKEALSKILPISVKISSSPFSNVLMISDQKTVLFATYSKASETTEHKNFVGVYTEDVNLARMFMRVFNLEWEEAQALSDEDGS